MVCFAFVVCVIFRGEGGLWGFFVAFFGFFLPDIFFRWTLKMVFCFYIVVYITVLVLYCSS